MSFSFNDKMLSWPRRPSMTTFNPGRCFVPRLGAMQGSMWCIFHLSRIFFRSFCTLCTAVGALNQSQFKLTWFLRFLRISLLWFILSNPGGLFVPITFPTGKHEAEGFVEWKQDIAHSMRFLRCTYGNQIGPFHLTDSKESCRSLKANLSTACTNAGIADIPPFTIFSWAHNKDGLVCLRIWFLKGTHVQSFPKKKKVAPRFWDTHTQRRRETARKSWKPNLRKTYSHS